MLDTGPGQLQLHYEPTSEAVSVMAVGHVLQVRTHLDRAKARPKQANLVPRDGDPNRIALGAAVCNSLRFRLISFHNSKIFIASTASGRQVRYY